MLALLRSLDLRLALLLGLALVMLHAAAVEFPRPVSLLEEPLTAGWRLAIAAVLVLTLWLGLFVYRHERYSGELWWPFALAGDAPRFLRAAVGMSIVVLLFALARLLGRRAPPAPGSSQPPEIIPAADRRTSPVTGDAGWVSRREVTAP